MQCFSGAHTFEAFPAHLNKMKAKVAGLSANEMDSTDRDAWVDYYCALFEIDPIVIYPECKEIDIEEKTLQEYNTWYHLDLSERKYFDRPGCRATCKVPFSGDPGLLELQPNPHTLARFEVDRIVKPGDDGIGALLLVYELFQRDATSEGIDGHFNEEISAIIAEAEKVNAEARQFNESLREIVEHEVNQRIQQLDKLAAIKQGLNIPLNRVKDAPMAMPMPLPKKKLAFSKPKPNKSNETMCSISDVDYETINAVIGECGAVMEQAPASFASLSEEQLRDYLRGMLGTHYDNVTGETFRNRGKTDIHIPFGNRVAFIAECKIWHGQKAFMKAIEQLFSYTTWRDTKVSVVVFNKENKNFDGVLGGIGNALEENVISVKRNKDAVWTCKVQDPVDERVMHVTVQAFNLYVRPTVA